MTISTDAHRITDPMRSAISTRATTIASAMTHACNPMNLGAATGRSARASSSAALPPGLTQPVLRTLCDGLSEVVSPSQGMRSFTGAPLRKERDDRGI